MKSTSRFLSALCLAVLAAQARGASPAPFELRGPGVDPAQFRATVFAGGLNYPKGMALLADGSLLVATNDPVQGSKSFYSSKGTLLRLVDADGDGAADVAPQRLFQGLPGSLSGLKAAGGLVFVVSTAQAITILRAGASPSDPLAYAGRIEFHLPDGWLHPPSDIAVRPSPGAANSIDLFFQVGSRSNKNPSTGTVSVDSDIGVAAELLGDSIYLMTITDEGGSLRGSAPRRIASGLRNAAGLAFHPESGDLYFQDNGIDGSPDPNEPLSADEVNLIAEGDIGGDVEDFGFPAGYVEYRSGGLVAGAAGQPLVAFQPLPDPRTGSESEGPAEIAFAPPLFPKQLRGGLFIGFHGKFNQGGIANEENPLVHWDPASGEYFHFIGNDEAGVGHLDGLLAAGDSLFVADLCSAGSVSSSPGTGVIYRIRSLAAPARFLRGDATRDRAVDVGDAVAILSYLFLGAQGPACLDAADANDDGSVDLTDAVAVLFALFVEGNPLPEPNAEEGEDPTEDSLPCT